jgi:hypothetical protein
MPLYLLIPIVLILVSLLLMGLLIFLGRFRNGKYMRSIAFTLAKIPFMRRFFVWSQKKVIEKQNPDLASVMRKLERLGPNADDRQKQQVISRFTRGERKAFDEWLVIQRDQGVLPEATNRRDRRRMQQRMGEPKRPAPSQAAKQAPPKKAGKRRR